MGSRIAPGWGLLLIDSRITVEQEAAQGATSTDSSYTQAGPRPGESVPDDDDSTWRPQVTGYQDQAVETIAITGGYAGPDRTGRPAAGLAAAFGAGAAGRGAGGGIESVERITSSPEPAIRSRSA